MTVYFDSEITNEGSLYNRPALITRLNELKDISEETGVSLENIIHYVGYNIIAGNILDMNASLAELKDAVNSIKLNN